MLKGVLLMKRRSLTAFALSLLLSTAAMPKIPASADAVSFAESTETVNNPGMGYTTTLWYRCKPGNTPVQNPAGSLVLMFVDIGAFSCGENGTTDSEGNYTPGTDYPLDDAFFAGLRGTFENCRKNGSTIALRFRYDDDGTRNPEPATFDMLKSHVKQIGDSGLLQDYSDILMYVESGFVGCYGEQWGGKYCSLEQKAELLDLLLDIVPDPIPVTVRTPNIFAKWAGIETSALGTWESEPGSRAARVGLYDDGYMGSDSDLGTYSDRAAETAWLGRQAVTSYFGGEFSGNLEFAQKYETYLPQNAIPEMYRTHLSYINSNIWNLYQNYTFSADYDVAEGDHSAYYGQNVQKFIRDHLGYRFVLRSAEIPEKAEQGDSLSVRFAVENTGFANPIRAQKAELLLAQNGNYLRTPVDIDSRTWRSCKTAEEALSVQLPGGLPAGKWNVYLKLSVGDNTVEQLSARSVRFANSGIWNDALGANLLGTVTIAKTSDDKKRTQTAFGKTAFPQMYTVNGIHITDGVLSNADEYGEAAGSSDTGTLYLASDERYLYLAAEFAGSGTAPVFNIQFKNTANDTDYWLYYASNGFVYFNHGTPEGCLQRHSSNFVEFRIPYGDVMGLAEGVTLTGVRFFLQDSADDWKLLSDVRAASFTVTGDIPVYTALTEAVLREGSSYPVRVDHGAEKAACQWYCDGKAISGAAGAEYKVPAVKGLYSVKITSDAGTVRTAEILRLTDVPGAASGDFNGDGAFDLADAVALQKYLLSADTDPADWKAGDMDSSGRLNAADLTLMKRRLMEA